jgi:integrase/recombinase XerC
LLFQAGLRISEALSLTTESLGDLDRNEIRVIGKGDKERIAVCSVHVVAALKAYLAVRDRLATPQSSNALFLGSRGDDLSRRGAEKMMKKRFPSGETSPHHLRHGFANRVLQAGADINAVKELLGHSNIATTSVYLHTDVPQLHRAVEKAFQ